MNINTQDELYKLARDTWNNLTNSDRLLISQLFSKRYYGWESLSDEKKRTMMELVRNVVAIHTSTQNQPDGNFVKLVRWLLANVEDAPLDKEHSVIADASAVALNQIGHIQYNPVVKKMSLLIDQPDGSVLSIVNIR